ncbi:hypothetical protein EDC96DRAFT_549197 [Choanephora cucurbitarum]|nr:hypothetical protein EDC96DRAFT_549197 [Choanephora cucurbitarum]
MIFTLMINTEVYPKIVMALIEIFKQKIYDYGRQFINTTEVFYLFGLRLEILHLTRKAMVFLKEMTKMRFTFFVYDHFHQKAHILDWEKLKAPWTTRYKDAIVHIKPDLKHVCKKLTTVKDSLWHRRYRRTTRKKPLTANIEEIKTKITRLEQQKGNTLVDRLNLMSFKLLESFEKLTNTQRKVCTKKQTSKKNRRLTLSVCCVRLSVLSIVNSSKKVYSDQCQKHLPLTTIKSPSSLPLPSYKGDIYYMAKHEGVDDVLAGAHLALPAKACDVEMLKETLIGLYNFKIIIRNS